MNEGFSIHGLREPLLRLRHQHQIVVAREQERTAHLLPAFWSHTSSAFAPPLPLGVPRRPYAFRINFFYVGRCDLLSFGLCDRIVRVKPYVYQSDGLASIIVQVRGKTQRRLGLAVTLCLNKSIYGVALIARENNPVFGHLY